MSTAQEFFGWRLPLAYRKRKGRAYQADTQRWNNVCTTLTLHACWVGSGETAYARLHYENMPIQINWKLYHQKMKIFRQKIPIFFIFLLKT